MGKLSSATLNARSGKTHVIYHKHKTLPWGVTSTMGAAQAGWGRGGPASTLQHPLPPDQGSPGVRASEKEVSTTHLFTLQVGLSPIHSTNIHLLLSLWQAQSQALKVDQEGQSPPAPCPQAFTVQKGRETQNWVGRRGGRKGGVVREGFLEEVSFET